MMDYRVITYNIEGKVLYESFHSSAGRAYREYIRKIELLRSRLPKSEKRIVARYNEGELMRYEIIEGAK